MAGRKISMRCPIGGTAGIRGLPAEILWIMAPIDRTMGRLPVGVTSVLEKRRGEGMGLILQVLGAILLLIILAVVVFVLTIRAKFRQLFRDLQGQAQDAASTATPPRIHLEAADAIDWDDEEAIEALVEPLPGLGFEDAGLYEFREMQGIRLHAWVNPEQAAIAVVYEHPVAGAWMDFVSRYDDGTRITFTNTGQGGAWTTSRAT